MLFLKPIADIAAQSLARSFRRWVFQLGGLGFIPLGLLDSSPVPVPGSMDVLVIVLCARKQELWIYYAAMATVGSVFGAWVTYSLARKGGREALRRRLSPAREKEIERRFSHSGGSAVLLPALLPPPAPLVPFLLFAGAVQYPVKKFLLLFASGRIVRYMLLAYLAARYGRKFLSFFSQAGRHPGEIVLVGVLAAVTVAGLILLSLWIHGRPQAG